MLRSLFLALGLMAWTHVTCAALPEDLEHDVQKRVKGIPSSDLFIESLSRLYDADKNQQSVRYFIEKILNVSMKTLGSLVRVSNIRNKMKTEHDITESEVWDNILHNAFKQYVLSPRASVLQYFDFFAQNGLDFTRHGACSGLSVLALLLSGRKNCKIDYTKYTYGEAIPFSTILEELPHLSEQWFHDTYRKIASRMRAATTQDTVDRACFRSLTAFLQTYCDAPFYIAASHENSFFRVPLHPIFKAQIHFSKNDSMDKLHDFLKHTLHKETKLLLEVIPQSSKFGHTGSIFCNDNRFSLWDSNAFSFESDSIEEFAKNVVLDTGYV